MPAPDDTRGDVALRRADLIDGIDRSTALDRRLRLAFVPAGLLGGGLAGITYAVLGSPMITVAMAANTFFLFLMIQSTRVRNRKDLEAMREQLKELDG